MLPTTNTSTSHSVRKNDIFVSYSRRDRDFVQRLVETFRQANYDPWVDWDDIREAEEWRKAIAKGIIDADTFIFVISPDSVASIECEKELLQAIQHNKRIIPIVHREASKVHPVLAELNWIFFRISDDFNNAFQKLIRAISTDLKHVQTHTRLLGRSIEWEHGRDDGFLLRGKDLETAEQWLAEAGNKEPLLTELQKQYIAKSREVEAANLRLAEAGRKANHIIRVGVGIAVATLIGSIVATAIVLHQTNQKVTALNQAKEWLEAEISKLKVIQDQLVQEREILIAALKEFGWTENAINTLLTKNPQSQVTNTVKQVITANSIYQNAVNSSASASMATEKQQRRNITVEYYPQNFDQATVSRALGKLGFNLQINQTASTNRPINTIFYGEDVDPEDVRLVAYCLIRAGVEIKSIQPLAENDQNSVIQVGAASEVQDKAPLTVETIRTGTFPL